MYPTKRPSRLVRAVHELDDMIHQPARQPQQQTSRLTWYRPRSIDEIARGVPMHEIKLQTK